ncbi:acid-sensing ion channel 1-like [Saccoglossus kowalevskii]|uniref:Acid-sensing ion channel 1-like n=1 Tax=Saccoglossus kowalevskii TaxID=10224 RepID=A0ABM0MQF3_SACKO|nr:PREDICTED: acid-sensing ion channel 1-like [Saccoglossus kowalevskii]
MKSPSNADIIRNVNRRRPTPTSTSFDMSNTEKFTSTSSLSLDGGNVRRRGAVYIFSRNFRQFLSETTLHGARYTANNEYHVVRRFFWCVLVIGVSIGLIIILWGEVSNYFQYPTNSLISIHYTSKLNFPAITLCNYNRNRKSVIGGTPVDALMTQLYSSARLDVKYNINFDWSLLENTTAILNRTQFELEAAHQKESFIVACNYQGDGVERLCGPNNFTTTFTEFGVCYTFNNDPENQLFVTKFGSNSGLRVRLFTDENEYTFGKQTGSGFKVLLYSPGDVPLVQQLGFAVPTGVDALVAIRLEKSINLPPPFPTKCSNAPLKYYDGNYTYVWCALEKITDFVVSACGCREPYMPGSKRVCNLKESIVCVIPVMDDSTERSVTYCGVGCDVTRFDSRVTYADFPAKPILEHMSSTTNESSEYFRRNYADISFFAEDMTFKLTKTVPVMTGATLVSNFGGLMGLCLGASLLTAVEFIDFILFCFCKS